MSAFFIFEIIKTRQNGQHCHFFKGPFLRNEWPYGYDFCCVFRDKCEASEEYNFAFFFFKIQQKLQHIKCQKLLKTQRPLTKKTGCFGAAKLHVPDITLQELFRMPLIKSAAFVVFKILRNLISMQNFFNGNNC